ncbi:PTS galactitol transporter subunit IIC [Caldibacillus thermoamylovorans]|uniref:PTS galactitol transporter subunit IIC n=1 Tax=Caldibacillus thermoamylovorans TaxID=35841 RepID=UPI00203D5E12|nr:PTS transporter subunit IIC [Caldibacillus thermoamylovorans]MCM3799932.1 PTS galactitol transporter subunit IIC [Caldibacillus thermoamylovorans]
MKEVIDYILSLGGTVFVPIILIIVGLLFGLSILKSIKSAATVGVGFLGLNLVVSLISQYLSPVVKAMVDRFGLHLTVIDVGSGTSAGIAFSTTVGALIIPVIFGLNVILLLLRLTKTMNIDIFNYSHYALTGSIVALISHNLAYGLFAAIIHAIFSLVVADLTAKRVQKIIGIDGISISQGYATSTVPLYALADKLFDKIPFLKNKNMDTQFIQKKFGMFGDPIIIGVILGIILSLLAGVGFKDAANVVIVVAGIMILFPRVIRIIVEGLLPISDAAKEFFKKRFGGKEFYIGLDSAVTLGHPTTITVGILIIPITLLLSAILPGNHVLPLADLAFAPFFVCMATIMHRGDVIRTLISSTINMILILYIATWFTPYYTELAQKGGFDVAKGGTEVSALYVGNVFDFIITILMKLGVVGIVALALITGIAIYFSVRKVHSNQNKHDVISG